MKRLIPLLVICLALGGCGKSGFVRYQLSGAAFGPADLKMVETNMAMVFPAGTKGLNLYYDHASSIDPSFLARIEIPSSSVSTFTSQLEKIVNVPSHVIGSMTNKVPWWLPTNASVRVEREYFPGTAYAHAVFSQEGTNWILYLEWFEM